MNNISVVIVSYNTKKLLENCLDSLRRSVGVRKWIKVWVVDNDSDDGSPEMVRKRFPWVDLIANEKNLGFAKANNQAIRNIKGEFIFLLNPDATIQKNTIETMLTYMNKHNKVGILGPMVLNSDGSIQKEISPFPKLLDSILVLLKLHRIKPLSYLVYPNYDYDKTQEAEHIMGSALFIRRKVFDPKKFDVKKEKENLGVKNKKVIMFLGSAKPHKGLENILLSVKRTGIQKIKVLVIGVAENNKWFIDIENKFSDILRSYKFIKFDQIPKFLSAADLVVLPQENNPSTYGQIPAKIFDAMSMEKPIISTNVSDIANILTDCGLVVEAGKVEQLSRAIKHIFENPLEAKRMAKRAREKCIREYSLKVMEKRLEQVFGGLK